MKTVKELVALFRTLSIAQVRQALEELRKDPDAYAAVSQFVQAAVKL